MGYEIEEYCWKPLEAINCLPIKVKGVAKIPIENKNDKHSYLIEMKVIVTPGFHYDLLLGNDFLEMTGTIINYSKGKIYFEPEIIELLRLL